MSGILIYSKKEAERNNFAIKKFKENLDIELIFEEDIEKHFKDEIKDKTDYNFKPDFVINRTNNGSIAQKFEEKGVRVFNPSSLSFLANDKQACYEFMSKNGIEIMPINYKKYPLVVKPKNGKGGLGVRLIESGEIPQDDNLVYQKVASDRGKDLRVWLIGNKIIASILRQSKDDFRSNFCLGGSATVYNLSTEEKELVLKIASLIKYDYIGIDFVFNNGKIVFNEIEDTVGARMVYSVTNIDILKEYCDYIKSII